MAALRRVCWDSSTWIAAITQEQVALDGGTEDRGKLCAAVLESARKGSVEIATSGLSLAEICGDRSIVSDDEDVLSDFFHNDFILVVPVNKQVGTLARRVLTSELREITPQDAVHAATAIVSGAAELQTFEPALLRLDGLIPRLDAGFLKITKPRLITAPAPLLASLES
jgi:predicted nucleic acid-binding protein